MMRLSLLLTLILCPVPVQAGLFDLFATTCLAPMAKGAAPDTLGLTQANPQKLGVRNPRPDDTDFYTAEAGALYVRVIRQKDMVHCSAHVTDRTSADLLVQDFDQTAAAFDLLRKTECDQSAADGSGIAYFLSQTDGGRMNIYLTTYQGPQVAWVGVTRTDWPKGC